MSAGGRTGHSGLGGEDARGQSAPVAESEPDARPGRIAQDGPEGRDVGVTPRGVSVVA